MFAWRKVFKGRRVPDVSSSKMTPASNSWMLDHPMAQTISPWLLNHQKEPYVPEEIEVWCKFTTTYQAIRPSYKTRCPEEEQCADGIMAELISEISEDHAY